MNNELNNKTNMVEAPGLYFKDDKTIKQINSIKEQVLEKLNTETTTEEIKEFANRLIDLSENNDIKVGLFDEFISNNRYFKPTNGNYNPPVNNVQNDQLSYRKDHKGCLLLYAGVDSHVASIIPFMNPNPENFLNSTINDEFKDIEFEYDGKSPVVKYKKNKIYVCKDMNKNVNLIISFTVYDKNLWEKAPEGIFNYVTIPMVINGDIVKGTTYMEDLTCGRCISEEWINKLLAKLKEWFDVDIKTI